jgi:drug/metabolite transporter (DMT)-like permease
VADFLCNLFPPWGVAMQLHHRSLIEINAASVLLALLGGVFTGVAHSLYVASMRFLKAKTVALIACLQPMYGIIFAAIVLHEYPSLRTTIGAAIVLAVAVMESLRSPPQPMVSTSRA